MREGTRTTGRWEGGLAPISGCWAVLAQDSQCLPPFEAVSVSPSRLSDGADSAAECYGNTNLLVQPICVCRPTNFPVRLSVASMTVSPILCRADWRWTPGHVRGSTPNGAPDRLGTSMGQKWTSGRPSWGWSA